MFTLEQIREAHSRVKSGADFPRYAADMRDLGVQHYDFFTEDGRTVYHGAGGFSVEQPPRYERKEVSDRASGEELGRFLKAHQAGESDFPTFCGQAAAAGVEKWRTDVDNMEVAYFDKSGIKLLSEPIPAV